jgi:hypothetical protein
VNADATPLVPIHVLREPEPSVDVPPSLAADDPDYLGWGSWKAPPLRRRNRTSEARIGHEGGHKIHLTIDIDAAGKPCAIWVEAHKEGAPFRGVLDTVAVLASRLLQHGASIQAVAKPMRGVRFEPDGEVHGHESITHCTSLVDLLGQMLLAEFSEVKP